MNINIRFSIIIPSHNRGYIIKECINSIITQTYNNFELIIVDDHSKDNTKEIINNINDSRIRYINLENRNGAQAARNEGIKNAKYDWICFNDSDDFWINNKLEINKYFLELNHYNKNIVYYNDCFIYNESKNEKTLWNLPKIDYNNSYISLLKNPGPTFPGLLFHKELIIKCGLLDESVPSFQEWDTSLVLAKNGGSFIHIKEPLFIYNLHSGETISKDITRDFNGYQYIIDKYKDDILKHTNINIWKNHLKSQYKKLLNNNLINSKLNDITQQYIKSLLLSINIYLLENNKNIFYKYLLKIKNKIKIKKYLLKK